MPYIEFFGDLLHRNLVFTVALAIVPLKLLMIRVSGDLEAQAETLLSIPEDLCYVTIGLILSSLTAESGPLQTHFAQSKHITTDIVIVLLINFAIILVVHKVAQTWTRTSYTSWRAATELRAEHSDDGQMQMALDLDATGDNLLLVSLHHLLTLLFTISLQFLIAGFWVYQIAAIYSNR